MTPIFPRKLRRGDLVRVVAPATSRAAVTNPEHTAIIERRFHAMGLRLSYGEHVDEIDEFRSSAIASRVSDLHSAFADPEVAAILTAIGGFSCNELLPHLDWELIRASPKVLCGFSDVTALQGAIWARTGLVTYSGPHWSSFGMSSHFEQTQQWFIDALFAPLRMNLEPAIQWTDDPWFLDQSRRSPVPNEGWWALQPGVACAHRRREPRHSEPLTRNAVHAEYGRDRAVHRG